MATAYPLLDRSGVDDDDAPLQSVQLPRAAPDAPLQSVQLPRPAPDSVSRPAPDVPPRPSRWRAALMLASLAAANVTLLGALAAVGSRYPAFVSRGVLAFSFGLRHAVDADHLAAIDCVSRKLIADRRPSLGVGLYFSLGHSTVVLLLCVGVAAGSAELKHRGGLERVGAVVGAAVSAGVLLLVGAVNVAIARGLFREWRALRSGGLVEEVHGDHDGGAGTHTHLVAVDADARIVAGPGFLARCCPRAFDVVDRAWKMYYVGFLFGLGFDTASEVALLALTALSAKDGLPPEIVLLLPLLFAAGMALVDTLDGVLMAWAYEIALKDPAKRLFLNFYLTVVSATVALSVAAVEVLGCVQAELELGGSFWSAVGAVNGHFEYLGYAILGFFAASLLGAWVLLRALAPATPKDDGDDLARALLADEAPAEPAKPPPPRAPYPVFDRSGID